MMNTTLVWHELTHASHFQRMKTENFPVAIYWSQNVAQQVENDLATGNPYRKKGDNNWQIIALSEGWASYREWKMGGRYLGRFDALNYATDNVGRNRYFSECGFPVSYGAMFDSLVYIGCSYQNIEKSLSTYSISDLRDNLIVKHPALKEKITNVIK